MDTYLQDTSIPIYIMLQYEGKSMKFPINPEALSVDSPSSSDTANVEGIGQVGIPQYTGLRTVTIQSFFWAQVDQIPSWTYASWLLEWQKSRKPATLIVTRLDFTFDVTCESFNYEIRAGEEKDIYFTLQMREYRKYGAKRLGSLEESKRLLEKVLDKIQSATPSVLFEVPRINRLSVMKVKITSPYTTKAKETITGITKKLTGGTDDWRALYEKNRDKLSGDVIEAGIQLIVPDSWVGESMDILEI